MGKLTSPRPEHTIQHFSHPHPLHLSQPPPTLALAPAPCSGCNLPASGLIYYCPPCKYFLHIKCSQFPLQITHPFHQIHIFSLLPKPIYPEGLFSCDACGKQGNGFSYHCRDCCVDLHVNCASMPLTITRPLHQHQLSLVFSPPYQNQSFCCDVCSQTGSNHWLYRCGLCDFDAHLDCAMVKLPAAPPVQAPITPPVQMQLQYQTVPLRAAPIIQPIQMQNVQTTSSVVPEFQIGLPTSFVDNLTKLVSKSQHQAFGTAQYPVRPYNFQQNYPPNNPTNNPNPGFFGSATTPGSYNNGQNNVMMNQAIQGFTSGASQAAGLQFFQTVVDDGDGGGSQ